MKRLAKIGTEPQNAQECLCFLCFLWFVTADGDFSKNANSFVACALLGTRGKSLVLGLQIPLKLML